MREGGEPQEFRTEEEQMTQEQYEKQMQEEWRDTAQDPEMMRAQENLDYLGSLRNPEDWAHPDTDQKIIMAGKVKVPLGKTVTKVRLVPC